MAKNKIRSLDIFRVFLRSFFVQSVWNYRSLISAGFGICLFPIVKRLYKDQASQKAFLDRHLKFFNAHPYMVSYALGVSIHLEEAFASGDESAGKKLDRIKELLTGILGAVGDKLFWSTIKPFSLIMGMAALMYTNTPFEWVIVLLCTFILYNTPHFYLRLTGIIEGYKKGINIYKQLGEKRFLPLQLFYTSVGVIGFLLFLIFLITKISMENPINLGVVLGAAALAGTIYNLKRNYYLTIISTLGISILAGILFL